MHGLGGCARADRVRGILVRLALGKAYSDKGVAQVEHKVGVLHRALAIYPSVRIAVRQNEAALERALAKEQRVVDAESAVCWQCDVDPLP